MRRSAQGTVIMGHPLKGKTNKNDFGRTGSSPVLSTFFGEVENWVPNGAGLYHFLHHFFKAYSNEHKQFLLTGSGESFCYFLSAPLPFFKHSCMNCEAYRLLSEKEKIEFIGSLVHVAQNDNSVFHSAKELIAYGRRKGLLDDVIINPSVSEDTVPGVVEY